MKKKKKKAKKKYKCNNCKDKILAVICPCEVANTGMDEFWKD